MPSRRDRTAPPAVAPAAYPAWGDRRARTTAWPPQLSRDAPRAAACHRRRRSHSRGRRDIPRLRTPEVGRAAPRTEGDIVVRSGSAQRARPRRNAGPNSARRALKPRLRLAEIVEQTGGLSEGARAQFGCEALRAASNVARVSVETFSGAVGRSVGELAGTGDPERDGAIGHPSFRRSLRGR